jgi:hypothetical protein
VLGRVCTARHQLGFVIQTPPFDHLFPLLTHARKSSVHSLAMNFWAEGTTVSGFCTTQTPAYSPQDE